jgi:GNAT superfamily N-acetyltransferase
VPDESRATWTDRTPARSRRRRAPLGIRRASAGDVATIARLRLALLREEGNSPLYAHPHPRALQQARDLTRQQLARPNEVFLLAARGESVVGVLRVREQARAALVRDLRVATITTAYVLPQERRRGALRALLCAADAWCGERGIGSLQLRCGAGNIAAQRAWRALGFSTVAVLMTRQRDRN